MENQKAQLIKKAFANKNYEWRTISGVAKEANVSTEEVKRYISSHGSEIVKSSSRNEVGESLYTLRESYRANAGVGSRISSIFRNRGA